jgi:hypothetical protein
VSFAVPSWDGRIGASIAGVEVVVKITLSIWMRTDQSYDRDLQDRRFGRKGSASAAIATHSTLVGDIRLFALTFAGGFLFMTVYLI